MRHGVRCGRKKRGAAIILGIAAHVAPKNRLPMKDIEGPQEPEGEEPEITSRRTISQAEESQNNMIQKLLQKLRYFLQKLFLYNFPAQCIGEEQYID